LTVRIIAPLLVSKDVWKGQYGKGVPPSTIRRDRESPLEHMALKLKKKGEPPA